jgi:hypothetical protein
VKTLPRFFLSSRYTRAMDTRIASIFLCGALAAASSAPLYAKGVTLVQLRSGTVKSYSDVDMRLGNQTLTLQTADRRGKLTITTGACSFAKEIERCLPYAVTLTQDGASRALSLAYGTVFLNLASVSHRLPFSSEELAPKTALVIFKTSHGTYVTAKGTLDEVKP